MKVVISLFLFYVVAFASQDAPEIKIEQGVLSGRYQKTWKGRTFSAFSGIPYAEPPVGDLRFKPPVPAKPWKNILDASKLPSICPQVNLFLNDLTAKGDEDCLYLNVYTPQLPESNNELLPVMFYIHGGGWTSGSGNPDLYGPDILLDKDVVLVTINYRLGALGFLSTEDKVLPGNNGFKDQNLALKWVKKNIVHFGGDPEKITIFGQSAGGASTHYHVLSPLSRDLIHGAIAHSGIATGMWALAPKGQAEKNAKRLAKFLNCPTTSNKKMVECLKKVDAYDIVEQDTKFMEWGTDPLIPFKPVLEPNIEGAFLTEEPIDIIKSGKAANVPFMTGLTTEDGAIRSAAVFNDSNLVEDLNKDSDRILSIMFMYHETSPNKEAVSQKLREFYFGDEDIDDSSKDKLTDICTDGYFASPQNAAVNLHTKYSKQPVYYFLFGYRGTKSFTPFFGDSSHDYGVCHQDELLYLFSTELFGEFKPNESAEKEMIDVMTTLWTNFAKTGNPTPETNSLIHTKWEPVKGENLNYYFIKSATDITMEKGLYSERTKIWKNLQTNHPVTRIKDEL